MVLVAEVAAMVVAVLVLIDEKRAGPQNQNRKKTMTKSFDKLDMAGSALLMDSFAVWLLLLEMKMKMKMMIMTVVSLVVF